jgi:hypothetical protein
MKTIATLLAAAAATLVTASALAADSSERTSMPTNCSERNANCVIQDGPPRARRGGETTTTTPPPGAGSSNPADTARGRGGDSKAGSGAAR